MRFLLDTNVISELVRPNPSIFVQSWISTVDEDSLFLSVITLTEIREGIERMPQSRRRHGLNEWLQHDLQNRFSGRMLHVDEAIADVCGRMRADCLAAGRPTAYMDLFIAATATVHSLTLVTRNSANFEILKVSQINPWIAQ